MKRVSFAALLLALVCAAAAEQASLTGRVVGPEGEGIAGARVALTYGVAEERGWVEAGTGKDGRFRLHFEPRRPREGWYLVAVAEGYAPGRALVTPGEPAEIVLPKDHGALTGAVVDPQGDPIAGARARVRWMSGEEGHGRVSMSFGDWPGAPADVTGEDGRFSLAPLPLAHRVSLHVQAEGYAYYHVASTQEGPVVGEDLTITLQPEAVITGRVTREGVGVGNVEVGVQSQRESFGGRAPTDEEGHYEIKGLPAATYNVIVVPPEKYTGVGHEGVQVKAGERAEGIDFELIKGSLVRGTVTWAETGEPVAEASIGAYGPAHPRSTAWVQSADTDGNGRYQLRLPPGENYVYWMGAPTRDAWYAEERDKTIQLEQGAAQNLDFQLHRKPTIGLTVFNPDGTPAPGVPVLWDGENRYQSSRRPERLLTDAQGQVALLFGRRREKPTRPLVPALAQDTERDLAGLAIINGETTREATITLASGAWIEATASEQDGTPIADMRVRVRTDEDDWSMDLPIAPYTDAQGNVRIGPLPPGVPLEVGPDWDYRSRMPHPPPEDIREPITLEPGETRQLEPWIIAPEGLSLRGRVVDAEGNPLEGAAVVCARTIDYEQDARAITDADGRFELTRLAASDQMVIAYDPEGGRAFAQPCDPRVAFEPLFELMPTGQLLVTVVDEGRPVPKARVQVSASGTGRPELPADLKVRTEWTEVDEQGRVRVTGLVPGIEYRVLAMVGPEDDPELVGWTEPSFLANDGPQEVSIELMTRQEIEAQGH